MAVATTYATEPELVLFMSETIGADMESVLNWSDLTTGYTRAVYAALRMVGVSDIADATDMDALEAAARYAVWTLARQHLAALPSTSVVETGSDLSSLYQHAVAEAKAARIDAMRTGVNYSVTSTAVTYTDIYGSLEETEG